MAEEEQSPMDELSNEEKEKLYDAIARSQAAPIGEEKHNVHTFLHNVAIAEDTTRIGFLTNDEMGVPQHPTRGYKEFALISEKIIGNDYYRDFFLKESENMTATSLSRDGFLVKQATTSTKQLADVTKRKRIARGWFKPKEKEEGAEES